MNEIWNQVANAAAQCFDELEKRRDWVAMKRLAEALLAVLPKR